MNRGLQIANLVGVLTIAVVCVLQWRVNRSLNLHTNALEKTRIEQKAIIDEQTRTIQGQTADMDTFRGQLQRATAELVVSQSNLTFVANEAANLRGERDQLKESIAAWKAAVAERDEQLKKVSAQIEELATARNDSVVKFNELAEKHNSVVGELNTRTRDYNSLVERYNALAGGKKAE